MNITTEQSTESMDAVMGYTHAGIINRLQAKLGITQLQATDLFDDLKRFLFLCATKPDKFAPTVQIDAAWHEFILHTRAYAAFCNNYLGEFIHHNPRESTSESFPLVLKSRTAAEAIFGELSPNWDVQSSVCSNGCCDDENG